MTDSTSDRTAAREGLPTPRQLAHEAAEAVRAINHQTSSAACGYAAAREVYDVVGDLRDLVERLPQALAQAARWLAAAHANGRLVDVEADSTTRRTVGVAVTNLTTGAGYAVSAGKHLARAHSATSRLATDTRLDEPIPFLPTGRAVRLTCPALLSPDQQEGA